MGDLKGKLVRWIVLFFLFLNGISNFYYFFWGLVYFFVYNCGELKDYSRC